MSKLRFILYTFIVIITGGALYLALLSQYEKTAVFPPVEQQAPAAMKKDIVKTTAHLYFANKNNSFLSAEERELLYAGDPVNFGKMIIAALADEPSQDLMRTLPAGVALRALFIDQDKTAYVDLTDAVKENHPGGVRAELLTIYSIVNSLVLNIQEIDTVKILIEGRESMTLCGHIDLRFPFKADMLLIR